MLRPDPYTLPAYSPNWKNFGISNSRKNWRDLT